MIEHIIYINLEHRIDRNEQIIKTLSEHFPKEIIHRIPGVLNIKNPQLGCAQAHINALEYAIKNNWNHVLIIEDDMVFNEFEKNYLKLQELMKSTYDIIVLGGVNVNYNDKTLKLYKCSSTGAYLIHKNYYHTLLANFKNGISGLIEETIKLQTRHFWWNLNKGSIDKRDSYIIDLYWQRLQERDNWFVIPLCYSKEGYSDIEKKIKNWEPYFLK